MATTQLTRTLAASDLDKWTFSTWVKKNGETGYQHLIAAVNGSAYTVIKFETGGQLSFENYDSGGSNAGQLKTDRLFRDPTAWYHIVGVWDSDNGSAGDRMKIYVNGVEETSFAADVNPSSDQDSTINSAVVHYIGARDGSDYLDGVLAHTHFCDGQAYAASDFGETDSTSGIWVPKTGPSVTYGTNGFFLKYQDTSNFGDDSSGNTNDFTVAGTMTQTKDTPMNNFATMNPLNDDNLSVDTAFAYGNNQITKSGKGGPTATMGVSKGKWYWEVKAVDIGLDMGPGFFDPMYTTGKNYVEAYLGQNTHGYGLLPVDGRTCYNGSCISYGSAVSNGDIIMMALDMDNKKVWWGLNGTWFASGDPAAGTNQAYSTIFSAYTSTTHFISPAIASNRDDEDGIYQFNFGNGYFGTTIVTSGVADGAGEGTFEYTPPTGFYALCTNNLATYG